jgi:DNA-binding response OmpR family regulator
MTSTAPPIQRRVLLVDDDQALLTSLSRGLLLRGFDVKTADAAGGAFESIAAGWPETVLLDVSMPGMDGVTFCRLIRDRYNVPILMLTARDSIEDRVTGLEAGADDYLVKPFALDEVVARIHALLRRTNGETRPRHRSREYLLENAWGTADAGTSNVVDAHMANLRRKLEENGRRRIVQTIRRVGYKLAME